MKIKSKKIIYLISALIFTLFATLGIKYILQNVNISFDISNQLWISIVLVMMSAALVISISISFYLYKWRRILLSNPHLIVPEDFGNYVQKLGEVVSNLTKKYDNDSNLITKICTNNSNRTNELFDAFMTLQNALDLKDAEIKRLKGNYDADVFIRFLKRFIRLSQHLDDIFDEKGQLSGDLDILKRLLDDALDECGVSRFQPRIGDPYEKTEGVADNPKTIFTKNKDDDFKIVENLQFGYRLKQNDGFKVIVPAKVKISIFNDKE